MKVYYVLARTRSANVPVEAGPFISRTEVERMAVEMGKRSDVQPQINIVTREVEDDEDASE